jgi:hypothetical protein
MMLAAVFGAVFAACLVGVLSSVGWLPTPIEPAPPRWANTDHDIFDIVLTDLIVNPEFDDVYGAPTPNKTQLVLIGRTDQTVRRRSLETMLGERTKEVPADACADLMDRNPEGKPCSLAQYQPSNPDVLVWHVPPGGHALDFSSDFPKARGFVVASLPGYSRDGRTALMCFSTADPPAGNGRTGCYLLRKVKGRWEIVLKRLDLIGDPY